MLWQQAPLMCELLRRAEAFTLHEDRVAIWLGNARPLLQVHCLTLVLGVLLPRAVKGIEQLGGELLLDCEVEARGQLEVLVLALEARGQLDEPVKATLHPTP